MHKCNRIQRRRHRVAVLFPFTLILHLMGLASTGMNKNFPKFINPGLEFYEGVSMAIDTLQMMKVRLDIRIL